MSGIYIPGIEMPKSCYLCPVNKDDGFGYFTCGVTLSECNFTKLPPDCPLVPVPEHGRLIEESKVLDIVFEWCPDDDGSVGKVGDLREMLDEIEALPSIIPADERLFDSLKRGLEQASNGECRSVEIPADKEREG